MSMIIGRFQKFEDGFSGSIDTLAFQVSVWMVRQEKGADYALHGPDNGELGAAWVKSGQFGDYLSVKLDGPSLLTPINAVMALKASPEGCYFLRWQRRGERNGNGQSE
jgi:uncharacterized protein (DUF736 family)